MAVPSSVPERSTKPSALGASGTASSDWNVSVRAISSPSVASSRTPWKPPSTTATASTSAPLLSATALFTLRSTFSVLSWRRSRISSPEPWNGHDTTQRSSELIEQLPVPTWSVSSADDES